MLEPLNVTYSLKQTSKSKRGIKGEQVKKQATDQTRNQQKRKADEVQVWFQMKGPGGKWGCVKGGHRG